MASISNRTLRYMGRIIAVFLPLPGILMITQSLAEGDMIRAELGLVYALAGGSLALFVWGLRWWWPLRRYKDIDPSDRGSAVWEGRVADADDRVTAPISGEQVPGVVYRVLGVRHREQNVILAEDIYAADGVRIEGSGGTIELQDGVDGDLIDAEAPIHEYELAVSNGDEGSFDDQRERRITEFIDRLESVHDISGPVRVKEQLLEAGTRVHLFGKMTQMDSVRRPDGSIDLRHGSVRDRRQTLVDQWEWARKRGLVLGVAAVVVFLL